MNEKKVFYTELAYALGLFFLAMGAAFMEKADFGMSMVVAPAYLLHLKISQYVQWFSFGMAEYCLQATLLVIMSIVLRRFKPMYLFSFCTAVIYGFVLDLCIRAVSYIPNDGILYQAVFYIVGIFLCAVGVAMLFHTYIAPEAYELLVKEVSARFDKNIAVTKTVYDCCSCITAVVMSFSFFGLWHFEGVKLGTIICAMINGWLIGRIGAFLEKRFEFRDSLPLRRFFS